MASSKTKREVTQAGQRHIKVTNLPWNTFRATANRGGMFVRFDGALVDFNADLADPLIEKINQAWQDVFGMKTWTELIDKEAIEAARIIIQTYATSIQEVLGDSHKMLMKHNLSKIRDDAILKLEAFRNIFEQMVTPEQRRASRVIKDTIKNMMWPTYEKCGRQKGSGCYFRMKKIMKDDLQRLKGTIFKTAGAKLEEEINSLKTKVCEHIVATLKNIHKEYKLQIVGLWIKQEGQQFSDSEVLEKAKTDLLPLLANKKESGQSVTSEVRKRNQPSSSGYSHQLANRRGQRTEGTLHLTFANPDDEREALRYYQENLPTFLRQRNMDVINIKQGSVVINFYVSHDFTKDTILDLFNFLRQGPPTPPSAIQTTMQPLPDVRFNLIINAENVQVGDNNTMNVHRQGTPTDQYSDSQVSSSTSQQSRSASQQASSTSPQSSSASQQSSSTSPQSSSASQQASSTSQQSSSASQQASSTSQQSSSASQQASSTSQQSSSASLQVSSTSPQSSMARQQASSTIAQSSMTSPKFITGGPGSDLGGSSGAQATSEYTENCTEVGTIRIKCATERIYHQIREVLDDLKNLMELPQVAMEIEENPSERTLSLHITRLDVAHTLSMWMMIKRIVNFRFLHEHLVSRTAMGGATYTITMPPATP